MPKTKTLKIISCLDCPHHAFERDPSSDDSFDWQDTALVCKKAKPTQKELASRILHEGDKSGSIILGGSRDPKAEYLREGSGIPDWCPL